MTTHDAPHPAGRPCWFDLFTPDPEEVLPFYRAVFPWEFRDLGPDMNHYRIATVDGRAAAGIGEIPADARYGAGWMVLFASEDVGAHAKIAKDLGGVVLMEPLRLPGQGRFAILRDPTGAEFGLWQAEPNIGFEVTGAPGAMAWCEVNTRDADAARRFYEVVLRAEAEILDAPGTTYWVLKQDDAPLGGILQMNQAWEGVAPSWMPYIQVADADEAARAAREHGGEVAVQPFDSSYGRIAVLRDPAGASFSVLQPPG